MAVTIECSVATSATTYRPTDRPARIRSGPGSPAEDPGSGPPAVRQGRPTSLALPCLTRRRRARQLPVAGQRGQHELVHTDEQAWQAAVTSKTRRGTRGAPACYTLRDPARGRSSRGTADLLHAGRLRRVAGDVGQDPQATDGSAPRRRRLGRCAPLFLSQLSAQYFCVCGVAGSCLGGVGSAAATVVRRVAATCRRGAVSWRVYDLT